MRLWLEGRSLPRGQGDPCGAYRWVSPKFPYSEISGDTPPGDPTLTAIPSLLGAGQDGLSTRSTLSLNERNNIMDANMKERIAAKIREDFSNNNALALWNVLRWNDNKYSRECARKMDPTAPVVSATMRAWTEWLHRKFPNLDSQLELQDAKRKEEQAVREQRFLLERLHRSATTGRRINSLSPLDFTRNLLSEGYKAEKQGFGLVRFVRGSTFYGPFRNKHINDAIRYIELSAETA